MLPTITVVTPSYNQAAYIEQTIQSVLTQQYPGLEYLVIDGGSTDGTVDILRRYEDRLDWVSEPDEGQAEAINKGLKRAGGQVVAWLNSDDIYLPGALERVGEQFGRQPDIDLVYGDYQLIDERGRVLLHKREIPFDYNILLYGLNYIGQPAAFFHRRVFDRAGYLDQGLHYGLDWEYWLRIASRGGRFAHLPHYLAATRWHGQAKTLVAPPEMFAEHEAIRRRYWTRRRFASPGWQRLYTAWLNKLYRFKRQALKIWLRRAIDFPPGHWVMRTQQQGRE